MTAVHVPIVETERLRLRPFRADDLDTYARWCGDAETMRFIGEGKAMSRSDAVGRFLRAESLRRARHRRRGRVRSGGGDDEAKRQ